MEELGRIQAAIDALRGSASANDDPPEWVTSPTPLKTTAAKTTTTAAPKKKRTMSAATRRKMAEGQKRRYAAINAAKGEAAAPRKTNSVKIAEAIAPPPEETAFKTRMSEIMKKAWAKRKAAAKKKTAKK